VGAVFNEAMSSYSSIENALVLEALAPCDFAGLSHLCDVGGGHGATLGSFLLQYPHLTGTVLGLPSVLAQPERLWAEKMGVGDRCTYVPGDMFQIGNQMVFTYMHRAALGGAGTFAGTEQTLAAVRRAGESYTFGFDPAGLPQYLAAQDLRLIEDVGASTYRERYLRPLARGHEPLAEFQRAAVVEVADERPRLLEHV
jgi:O-methyltransferase domain